MTKFCTECGSKLTDTYKFCPNCGVKIISSEEEPAGPNQFNQSEHPSEEISDLIICDNCGEEHTADNFVCEGCGVKLKGTISKKPSQLPKVENIEKKLEHKNGVAKKKNIKVKNHKPKSQIK